MEASQKSVSVSKIPKPRSRSKRVPAPKDAPYAWAAKTPRKSQQDNPGFRKFRECEIREGPAVRKGHRLFRPAIFWGFTRPSARQKGPNAASLNWLPQT